jgi:small-conductance mechanosensitive channel
MLLNIQSIHSRRDVYFMEHFWAWLNNSTIQKLTMSILALILIFSLIYLAKFLTKHYIEDPEARFRVRKWSKILSYIVGLLLIIAIFSDQLGGLAVFLGAVGVGIAFALQEVIASFAGWLAILIGKFYRTGDRVQLGGIKGDVIDIGVVRTTLMEIGEWLDSDLYTGRIVRIANSFIFKEPVFNYTSDFPFLWDEIKIPIRHGSDYVLTREIMQNIAQEISGPVISEASLSWKEVKRSYFIDEVMLGPQTTMKITDNWLEFTVRYIVEYRKRRYTRDLLFSRILDDLNRYPEKITIASTTIALVEVPTVQIKLAEPNPSSNKL